MADDDIKMKSTEIIVSATTSATSSSQVSADENDVIKLFSKQVYANKYNFINIINYLMISK